MLKKSAILFLTVVMLCFAFAGCADNNDKDYVSPSPVVGDNDVDDDDNDLIDGDDDDDLIPDAENGEIEDNNGTAGKDDDLVTGDNDTGLNDDATASPAVAR